MSEREDKYSVTIDGRPWRFNGLGWDDRHAGMSVTPMRNPYTAMTPAELRAIADVQERWERDHTPKRQVRVRLVEGRKAFANPKMWLWEGGVAKFVHDRLDLDNGALYTEYVDTDDLTAILDLRDHGAWEESLDGGTTWTPTHNGPDDD
jgi:hypothetical protein